MSVKTALLGLTRTLAPEDIQVNCVVMRLIKTIFSQVVSTEAYPLFPSWLSGNPSQ